MKSFHNIEKTGSMTFCIGKDIRMNLHNENLRTIGSADIITTDFNPLKRKPTQFMRTIGSAHIKNNFLPLGEVDD